MDSFYILVDKPSGITSFDLVAKLRRILKEKSIGHSGTLDKMATGLMLVAVGKEALKMMEFLIGMDKVYEAEMLLGLTSDTYDITGNVESGQWSVVSGQSENCDLRFAICEENINKVMQSFLGEIEQVPPKFSALKIDGKRASDRVRDGENIEMKARKVSIFSIENSELSRKLSGQNSDALIEKYPNLKNIPGLYSLFPILYSSFIVHCSSGTYIRSLIHDIGQKLACGALMTDLRRVRIGNFDIKNAFTLEKIEEAMLDKKTETFKLNINDLTKSIFEAIDLSKEEFREIKFGRKIKNRFKTKNNLIAAFFEGRLVSILEKDLEFLKVYKNFITNNN